MLKEPTTTTTSPDFPSTFTLKEKVVEGENQAEMDNG